MFMGRKVFVVGITVLMLLNGMSVSAQKKKFEFKPLSDKAYVKSLEKEGWFVIDGDSLKGRQGHIEGVGIGSLSAALARYDTLGLGILDKIREGGGSYPPDFVFPLKIIGFSYGEYYPEFAISKAEEDAIRQCAARFIGCFSRYESDESEDEYRIMKSKDIRKIDADTFQSAMDTIFWSFPMPEFVLLRDRGYGYYDCRSFYFIDGNTNKKIRNIIENMRTAVRVRGVIIDIPREKKTENLIQEMENKLTEEERERIRFNEQEYREKVKKAFEEYKEDYKPKPCQEVYDTPEEFAITASSRGSLNEREKVQKSALATAQALIRPKMQHAYKSLLSGYSTSLIHKKDYDIERKMDSAGIRVIDRIINETSASCVGWGEIEDDGQITCYTAIRIPKGDVAAEITKEVADKLTREEKDLFGFNEQKFRKEMKKHFEEYKRNAE